jgi:hypothetical protein
VKSATLRDSVQQQNGNATHGLSSMRTSAPMNTPSWMDAPMADATPPASTIVSSTCSTPPSSATPRTARSFDRLQQHRSVPHFQG